MSLNLGPVAFEAVQKLKGTSEWQALKAVLVDQMGRFMHGAIETGPTGNAVDACGYARAFRDLVWAIEAIERAPQQARQKPEVPIHPGEEDLPTEDDIKAGAAVSAEAQRRTDLGTPSHRGRR